MRAHTGFRQAGLGEALDRAIAGNTDKLYDQLARASGLPGPRANEGIVQAFAVECAARGKPAEKLVVKLVTIDADVAQGNTAFEILPICGTAAAAHRAKTDPTRLDWAMELLAHAADDLRFRVRDEAVTSLAFLGETLGDRLIEIAMDKWMDGYFHASAMIEALCDQRFLNTRTDPTTALDLLDAAFATLKNAERAAARYPGHKALMATMSVAPAKLAQRFGAALYMRLEAWATSKDPDLRDLVEKALRGKSAIRYQEAAQRVSKVLDATAPVRRDPKTDVGPTRRRGKASKNPRRG